MKAVILAAGLSKRLRPLTDTTPKCLLDVNGKNFLQRTLDNLLACGIYDFIMVLGYRKDMIEKFVRENYPEIKITFLYNDNYSENNNSYSLWMTKDIAGDEILLLDSDILFEKEIVSEVLSSAHGTCLALKKDVLDDEQIKVIADETGKVTEISKEAPIDKAIGESIGIEKISGKFLKDVFDILDRKILTEKNVNEFYEKTFEEVISKNDAEKCMYCVDISQYFCMEIDTIEDYESAKKLTLNF